MGPAALPANEPDPWLAWAAVWRRRLRQWLRGCLFRTGGRGRTERARSGGAAGAAADVGAAVALGADSPREAPQPAHTDEAAVLGMAPVLRAVAGGSGVAEAPGAAEAGRLGGGGWRRGNGGGDAGSVGGRWRGGAGLQARRTRLCGIRTSARAGRVAPGGIAALVVKRLQVAALGVVGSAAAMPAGAATVELNRTTSLAGIHRAEEAMAWLGRAVAAEWRRLALARRARRMHS